MRMWTGVCVLTMLGTCCSAAEVEQNGTRWRIENKALRVTVDAETGDVSALDKRIDYTWRQSQSGEAVETLLIPRAGRSAGDAALPASFELLPSMTAHAKEVDGPRDLSGVVRLAWDDEALRFELTIRDEQHAFATAEDDEWWEKDSVEFWINARQFGVALEPSAPALVLDGKPVSHDRGYSLTVTAENGRGYVVVASVPWDVLGLSRDDVPMFRMFRFALGVNDADDAEGRQGQLYYPTTWVHSNPNTFAQAVLADADGNVPAAPEGESRLRNVRKVDGGITYETLAPAGSGQVACTVTLTLAGDAPDLIVETDVTDRSVGLPSFGPLRPFTLDSEQAFVPAARYCDGLLFDCDDMQWKGTRWTTHGSLDMPWVGLTDLDKGYMLLAETPDDGVVVLEASDVGGKQRLAPAMLWQNSKGEFRYPRRMMISFVRSGGYVAICKRYRAYAKEHGFLVTQREKEKTIPDVARLAGAPDIWGAGGLEFCREAKAAGMDRMLVNWRGPAEDMEAIKDLGYVISEYDNYVDIQEGPLSESNRAPLPASAIKDAKGESVRGWVTWDKKTTFMKLCPALAVEAATLEIVPLLAKHPFNTRFLDVTTASGLRECYDGEHPLTRTEYRHANEALAEYVSGLGLVLGGEHGRWYGVPYFHYWEGMQSGGFYSWPAGHVGVDIPETRESIGENYLKYGIGHVYRVPLWELCFHDCVVSTWYWGDSTGHLYKAAPEIADKKDAFNVLYGTVPLYWVSRPYSFNWREPELRARLLASYRNTCKLHEQIAFEEMVSHEFITEDHAVQKTAFGDGTEVWVNFGEEAWTLERGDTEYVLPQYGFLATGSNVLQYRALVDRREVTYIKTAGYAHCDPGGQLHDFGVARTSVPLTIRATGANTLTVHVEQDATEGPLVLRPGQVIGKWRPKPWAAYGLGPDGARQRRVSAELNSDGEIVLGKPEAGTYAVLWGRAANRPDLAIVPDSLTVEVDAEKQQAVASAKVLNEGPKHATGVCTFTIVTAKGPVELGRATVKPSGPAPKRVQTAFATDRLDGPWTITASVRPDPNEEELLDNNNQASATVSFPVDYSTWQHSAHVSVDAGPVDRHDEPVIAALDLGELLGVDADTLDLESLRVVEIVERGELKGPVPAQLDLGEGGAGELVFLLPEGTPAGASRTFAVLCNEKTGESPYAPTGSIVWDEAEQAVTTPAYRVGFKDGVISSCHSLRGERPAESFLRVLGVSSQDTGWVDEVGELTGFDVLHWGPARLVVRVTKSLQGGYEYEKTYAFYWDYFTVSAKANKLIGLYSRAYYVLPGQFEDDKGNRAWVDGEGDAEEVSGKNADPRWYAVYGDGWAHSCVALTPFSNFTYWDGGAWGGIGFGTGRTDDVRLAYVIHPQQADASFAELDCERLTNPPTVTFKP